MKVGSIVVVKKIPIGSYEPYIKWVPVQDENTPYMVRQIRQLDNEPEPGVMFEEGTIGFVPNGTEVAVKISYVREILPPEDITEQIEDMMCVPVENTIANAVKKLKNKLGKYV